MLISRYIYPNSSTIACIVCSVRATIERYKKACAASTNTESVSEANTQVIKCNINYYCFKK
jgi:hypothetical protein